MSPKKTKFFTFLDGNRKIIDAANIARTEINMYRNTERVNNWNTFFHHIDPVKFVDITKLPREMPSEIDSRPEPHILSDMTENIIIYLNRNMQHLAQLVFDKEPHPNTHNSFYKLQIMCQKQEPQRQEDVMLFTSNTLIQINNLDSNLFKQVISTLYNKYNKETDSVCMKIPSLKERLQSEFPDTYNSVFNNGLELEKHLLMQLRNTAGHSDIKRKIDYHPGGNPRVWIDEKNVLLYPILEQLSLSYMQKATNVYRSLSREVRTKQGNNIPKSLEESVKNEHIVPINTLIN